MSRAFLDTGYVIALEASDDQHHKEAKHYWQGFLGQKPRLITTTYIFDEIVTFFNNRGRHAKAVEVGRRLLHSLAQITLHKIAWHLGGEAMRAIQTYAVLERAREAYPEVTSRVISDNGPQFIAREFKEYIRIAGMTHIRMSPYYPQSNGKIERWHRTVKGDCIRWRIPLSLENARRIVAEFVREYNTKRLHGAIGYVVLQDKAQGREKAIWAERDRKPAAARERRRRAWKTEPFLSAALTQSGAATKKALVDGDLRCEHQPFECPQGDEDCQQTAALVCGLS